MSVSYGPSIPRGGLVFSIDPMSVRSNKNRYNLANNSNWNFVDPGTSITNWTMNGSSTENRRFANTNPLGVTSLIWDTPSNDADSGADGGFNSGRWAIDPTYYYRHSCWIKRQVLGNGSVYLGLYGYNSLNQNMGVLNRSNSANNTNPYFYAGAWDSGYGLSANQWYLFVGYTFPQGSGSGAVHADHGIYNTSGTKVSSGGSDYVWQEGNVQTAIRSYLYYSTTTTTAQCWWNPRIDKLDGTEPSIADLIDGHGGKLIDTSRYRYDAIAANGAEINLSNTSPIIRLNGSNSYFEIPNWYDFSDSNALTLSMWVKSDTSTWNAVGCLWSKRNQFIIHPSTGGTSVSFYVYTTTWEAVTYAMSNIDSWNQIGMVYKDGALKAYVNGVNVASASKGATLGSDTGSGYIGWDDGQASRYFDGDIGQCHAWNRNLSVDEMNRLFNAERARYGV